MSRSPDGVSKTGMRARNLSALLTHVHHRGVVSRADLVDSLGLSKTTVSALIDELLRLGWIESAGSQARTGAGRPGELIAPSSCRAVLVVNPEFDGTTLALVAMGGRILRKHHEPLRGSRRLTPGMLARQAQRFLAAPEVREFSVQAAVIVVPGAVDAQTQKVVAAPSIGWRGVDANSALAKVLALPCVTLNNGRASTIGEWAFGEARGRQNAVCVFSSSGGIGGGLIINGSVATGAAGLAGEVGKMRIHDSDLGMPGNLNFEHLMRRDAIVEEMGFQQLDDAQFHAALLSVSKQRALTTATNQGRVLANAIATLRDLLDPEVIVLGGYLGSLAESQRKEMLRYINVGALTLRGNEFLATRPIGLGEIVLLGAAETHWTRVLADPISNEGELTCTSPSTSMTPARSPERGSRGRT